MILRPRESSTQISEIRFMMDDKKRFAIKTNRFASVASLMQPLCIIRSWSKHMSHNPHANKWGEIVTTKYSMYIVYKQ